MNSIQIASSSATIRLIQIYLQLYNHQIIKLADRMNNQVIQNIRQQKKRLLDQLQQLQQNKADLTPQQYNDIKQSTLADLQTFQTFLLTCQKGDQLLQSEIEKSKKQIMEAVKKSFDKEKVLGSIIKNQVNGLKQQIKCLDDAYHLKKIANADYFGGKRKLLVEILDIGGEISEEERNWLELNHFDKSKGDISQSAGSKHMQIAGKNIKQLD